MIDPQLAYERAEPEYVDDTQNEAADALGVCSGCGEDRYPCSCVLRDEDADRRYEEMRERRHGG